MHGHVLTGEVLHVEDDGAITGRKARARAVRDQRPGPPDQLIGPCSAAQRVVSATAVGDIVAGSEVESIVLLVPDHGIVRRCSDDVLDVCQRVRVTKAVDGTAGLYGCEANCDMIDG